MSEVTIKGGLSYKIGDFFFGEQRAIIIPDSQRDYCWGDPIHTSEHKDLVRGFVNNLIELFSSPHRLVDEDFNLGLIYGYEQPSNHIQLCDGQQRITTLFLLVGMLNRHLGNDSLKRFLISEYEENDDKEPHLRYSIRESSLYFLSDLVCRFFIRGNVKFWPLATETIRNSEWYYNDYDQDPSIQSMLRAIGIMEKIISQQSEINWSDFADFILKRLTIMYYDMETRENGEETFVIINTTGEPLSATENLKPLAIASPINEKYSPRGKSIAEDWEEIETWFWRNRANENDTAETGFNEFLRWVTLLHYSGTFSTGDKNKMKVQNILSNNSFVFPVHEIPFSTVYDCWTMVKTIFDNWNEVLDKNWLSPKDGTITQIDCFKLLPLIAWYYHHNKSPQDERNQLRVYRYFENLARLESVGRSVNDLIPEAIAIACNHEDVVELADLPKKDISQSLCPEEERLKLCLMKNEPDRLSLEEAIWKVQAEEVWKGEIAPLLEWSGAPASFNRELFDKYTNAIEEYIYPGQKDEDEVRRALLAREFSGYPLKCGKNLSFCNEPWQWKEVIQRNSSKMKSFLDALIEGTKCSDIIDARNPKNAWIAFIDDKRYLSLCGKKNIQIDEKSNIFLLKGSNARTFFALQQLETAKQQFGVDSNGILYFDFQKIGLKRKLAGHDFFFQWWLHPNENQADLYLMENGTEPDAYVYIPGNENSSDDLKQFRCMKITETMTKESISYEMLKLVAAKIIEGGDTLLQKARYLFGAEEFLEFDSNSIKFQRQLAGQTRCFLWRLSSNAGQSNLYLMVDDTKPDAFVIISGSDDNSNDLINYRCIKVDDTMTPEFITDELQKWTIVNRNSP